jgi:hypothetical protein
MKQIMLVIMLAAATSTFARLGDTQKEFEQANPDFKYMGESQGDGNTRPMGSDRRLLNPSPKLARALARFPEQWTEFDQPEAVSK